ncbi:MAG TPA: transglutaminase domain-containing protein, partial [Dokdonella sp.]
MIARMRATHVHVSAEVRRAARWATVLIAALLAGGAEPVAAAPQRGEPAAAGTAHEAVTHALLEGRDARSAVAEAIAQEGSVRKGSMALPDAPTSAMGAYASGIERVHGALLAAQQAWSPTTTAAARARLAHALEDLLAQHLLIDARIAQIDQHVAAESTPAIARERWAGARASLVDRISRVDDAARSALDSIRADGSLRLGNLAEVVTLELRSAAPAVYGASTLPVFRPRLAARDPVLAPVITPSYANAEEEVSPIAADYAVNDDTPLSASIVQQAEALGRDYARIFDFVRGQIHTQWYAGAQKGAEGALRTRSGNDVDQASLLIALLRASGAPARYVQGVFEVPVVDLASMLGVPSADVGRALAAAGIANRPVVAGGQIRAFSIEHVYVSAWLPFVNYRGTAADLDARTWIPLAPAIKPHAFVPAQGAIGQAGISPTDFAEQFLGISQPIAPLDLLRQRVADSLAQLTPPLDLQGALSRHEVDALPLGLLPASLPVPVRAVTGEFAELPDSLRQTARIVVR